MEKIELGFTHYYVQHKNGDRTTVFARQEGTFFKINKLKILIFFIFY